MYGICKYFRAPNYKCNNCKINVLDPEPYIVLVNTLELRTIYNNCKINIQEARPCM